MVRPEGQPQQSGELKIKMIGISYLKVSNAPETSLLLGVHQFDFSSVLDDKCSLDQSVVKDLEKCIQFTRSFLSELVSDDISTCFIIYSISGETNQNY